MAGVNPRPQNARLAEVILSMQVAVLDVAPYNDGDNQHKEKDQVTANYLGDASVFSPPGDTILPLSLTMFKEIP